MDEEDLDPREAERDRRRDREAQAAQRELMRAGMGKVFKQIQDAQKKAAEEPPLIFGSGGEGFDRGG